MSSESRHFKNGIRYKGNTEKKISSRIIYNNYYCINSSRTNLIATLTVWFALSNGVFLIFVSKINTEVNGNADQNSLIIICNCYYNNSTLILIELPS